MGRVYVGMQAAAKLREGKSEVGEQPSMQEAALEVGCSQFRFKCWDALLINSWCLSEAMEHMPLLYARRIEALTLLFVTCMRSA